jgi:hypothetical protein
VRVKAERFSIDCNRIAVGDAIRQITLMKTNCHFSLKTRKKIANMNQDGRLKLWR